jgi:phenylalanyl-tRNA synthetase beta chain
MKVAVEWIRSFGDFEDLNDEQLADKLTMAGLEVEEVHGTGSGKVFVTKVTPNRGDWMSIYGVAREAAAAASLPLNRPIPLSSLPKAGSIGSFTVDVVDESLCPRFAVAVINGVQHKPSPKFIQDRLALAGMRPLNAVVDITNYVMLELGQPLHAYDQATLAGNKIIVRPAKDGETIKTLDGADHALAGDMLVIADTNSPIAIAGIMGGALTEYTEATTTIVLESAHFDASVVRRGAKKLGISTEASYRFERFVDPELVPVALARAIDLLVEYAGGTPVNAAIDTLSAPLAPVHIELRTARVNLILGLTLSTQETADALTRLGLKVQGGGGVLSVFVPTFRPDLKTEIDLIEEVGRMIGYWNLPETVPSRPGTMAGDFEKGRFDSVLRSVMVGQGLVETYSHTLGSVSPFDDPEIVGLRVEVRSSLSNELSGLRLSLLPHLLDALALNLRFGAGAVRLFETGKVFRINPAGGFDEPRHVASVLTGSQADYATAKGIAENILEALNIKTAVFEPFHRHAMHSGRCANVIADGQSIGYVAEMDPYLVTEFLELPPSSGRIAVFELDVEKLRYLYDQLSKRTYIPLPKFPSVTRDIALLYDLGVTYGAMKLVIEETAGELLENLSLLSIYTGDRVAAGQKSVAIRLTFRSKTRTLTESDAESAVNAVKSALAEKLAAKER